MSNKYELDDLYEEKGCVAAIAVVLIVLALAFGLICLEAWALMALWNSCLVPAVIVLNEVGFWQMWGIMVVCNSLFKGWIHWGKKKDK